MKIKHRASEETIKTREEFILRMCANQGVTVKQLYAICPALAQRMKEAH